MKVNRLNEDRNYLSFKQLVKLFSEVITREDYDKAVSEIDQSFQNNKITWNDHELLYNLSDRIGKGVGADVHILNR